MYVHFTYKAPRRTNIKFDSGPLGILSVSVNIISNSNWHSEASSVRNRQGQSHRLLVNIDICRTAFFFFFLLWDIKEKNKNINQRVLQLKQTFSNLLCCQSARLFILGSSEHHSVKSSACRNNDLKCTPISFSRFWITRLGTDYRMFNFSNCGDTSQIKLARFLASATKLMRTGLLWAITQRVEVIPYRPFRTTYRSHVQGSRTQENSWPLQMGPIACPETSANTTIHHVIAQKSAVLESTCIFHRNPTPILFEQQLNVNRTSPEREQF